MDDLQRQKLVTAWISYWHWCEQNPGWHERNDTHPDEWATAELDDLCDADPDQAFRIILDVLAADSTSYIKSVLAAGPLEDLLARHGPFVIDRIEQQARTNPKFRELLGGVWENRTDPLVWARVTAVRGEPW